jgi:hypothetical protein
MTVWRMRIACWMPKATNTQSNTYCCSTTKMVGRTRLNVTSYVRCFVLYIQKTVHKRLSRPMHATLLQRMYSPTSGVNPCGLDMYTLSPIIVFSLNLYQNFPTNTYHKLRAYRSFIRHLVFSLLHPGLPPLEALNCSGAQLHKLSPLQF